MSSDPDRGDPKEDLKQGLGLLWRAARKTAGELRKDLDRTNVTKVLDDASREFVRAASNVVGRLGAELGKIQPPEPRYADRQDKKGEPGADEATRPPAGPTPDDPGFRIAVDRADDEDKPR